MTSPVKREFMQPHGGQLDLVITSATLLGGSLIWRSFSRHINTKIRVFITKFQAAKSKANAGVSEERRREEETRRLLWRREQRRLQREWRRKQLQQQQQQQQPSSRDVSSTRPSTRQRSVAREGDMEAIGGADKSEGDAGGGGGAAMDIGVAAATAAANEKLREAEDAKEEEEEERYDGMPQWEKDYYLAHEDWGMEYADLTLQFTLMVCFITACPLGPLFVLAHNILGLRMTARRSLVDLQRPAARWVNYSIRFF